MPDYIRAQVDAMGPPRSPAGSDSPLSLVIYKKGHDHHVRQHRHEHALTIHMAPASPSRSSGFSETDELPHQNNAEHYHDVIMADENGDEAGNLVVAVEEEVVDGRDEEEVPLSLVVEKHVSSDDSGHGEDDGRFFHPEISFERRSRIENEEGQRVEIEPKVTIARIQERSSSSEESNVTATGIKIKDFARFNMDNAEAVQIPPEILRYEHTRAALLAPRKSKTSESDEDQDDDEDSDMSSDDSWGTESAHEGGAPRAYPCHYCDKVFANRHHLMSHVVTHTGERNFSCRKCGKCFGRKSTLRAHMTTHTGTSNFMCPLCDKACNDNNSLEEHIRMHTGEKPFVCAICSKAYARKSHLNVHYRVHTGERPFVCTDCGKDFTEKRFLNDHAQTAHNGHDGPLKCPNCFREFAYKTSLKQHLKKQMCVKNLNRGQGGQGHGAHAKQFACPFCEKSYSWKQTLKQHVSMYHRNKVHTDEFWKYELAKHRRTVLDNETNEDMWRRQLGKHASVGSGSGEMILNRRASIHGSLLHELDHSHEDKWLDQIKRSSEGPASADMKLLALRSLHSSLQHMSASAAATASLRYGSEHQQPLGRQEEEEEFAPTREDGYLAMLANVSYNRREREPSQDWQQPLQQQQQLQQQPQDLKSVSNSPQWEVLKDIKEEPAAKRTQMWLAQLGQYRQRELQEELDRSHDELWEEQIARIKHNPIRSPLEAVEITIDEDQDEAKAIAAATARKLEQRARPPAMLPLMMSALQVRPAPPPPPPPALSPILSRGPSPQRLTLTLHSSDGESEGSTPRKVPAYYTEESNNNNNNNNNVVIPRHVPLAPPPLPQRSLPIPIPRITHPVKPDGPSPKSNSPPTDSVLKSLLLDAAASRKRPISPPPTPTATTPSPTKSRFSVADETDILRRRLLGLKDVVEPATPSKMAMPMPRFAPPSATVTSKDVTPLNVTSPVHHHHISPKQQQRPLEDGEKAAVSRIPLLSIPDDASSEEDRSRSSGQDKEQPQQQQQQQQQPCLNDSSYKRTSVLKHLLHRYNNDATDNNNSSSNNNNNNSSSKGEL